ncbi:M4 family metallopeptidase [Streptomyces nodosus]|uniref:M4 family metallopeptidase n=1 Tax=Streptomyces nodosus TaxID=40318 RepID=UPI00383094A0
MRTQLISKLAVTVAIGTVATASITGPAVADPTPAAAFSAAKAAEPRDAVIAAARAASYAHGAETGIEAGSKLDAIDVMVDPNGKQHVRFSQAYQGVPVLGGDIVVHLSPASAYLGVTRTTSATIGVPTVEAKLTVQQARTKAASQVTDGVAQKAQLVIQHVDGKSTLAYQIDVTPADGALDKARTVVVDAASGAVLSSTEAAEGFITPEVYGKLRSRGGSVASGTTTAATLAAGPAAAAAYPTAAVGSGLSLFSGTVVLGTTQTAASSFSLVDATRGKSEIRDGKHTSTMNTSTFTNASVLTDADNVWGNGTTSDNATAAVDAHYGLAATYDFYKSAYNRQGIKNDGVGSHGVVHFGNDLGNAYWSDACQCMLYGDGDRSTFTKPLVQLDVTGHELTHGVVNATAKLQTSSNAKIGQEPGALNESLADIFASGVEFKTAAPGNPGNYLVGEQLGLAQGFLRRLDKPSLDKLEGTIDYWSTTTARTEVHAGSGVSSHAFYLLAEGSGSKTINGVSYNSPTYDGAAVTGIGRDAALAIFYQALTRYMVSTTNFHGARTSTLQAAADLYGSGSTQYKAVDRAWAAVNVTASNG